MIHTFGIIVDSVSLGYKQNKTIYLHTPIFQNILALTKEWNMLSNDPTDARPDPIGAGDGDQILQKTSDTAITLNYKFGWNDCPSGCIGRHYWVFTIYPDCSVRYNNSYGDDLFLAEVKAESNANSNLSLYPDPTSNKITIENRIGNTIEIVDINEQILEKILINSDQEEVDVSRLPKGMYFVKATDKKGTISTAKFVKE